MSGDTNTGGRIPARDVGGSFLEADGRKRPGWPRRPTEDNRDWTARPGRSVPSGCSPDRAGARRGRAMCLGGPRRRTQAGPDRGSRQPADSCREPGGRLDGPFRVLRGGSPRSAARRGGASRISGHGGPQEAGIALYGPLRASQADFAPDRTGPIARSGRERPFRERIRAWPAAIRTPTSSPGSRCATPPVPRRAGSGQARTVALHVPASPAPRRPGRPVAGGRDPVQPASGGAVRRQSCRDASPGRAAPPRS